jgi:hypothetical protein
MEDEMPDQPNDIIRIELTMEQKRLVKAATSQDADALVLSIQELEQRIAPGMFSNHNETLLVDGI